MNIPKFYSAAQDELNAAATYYENQQPALGRRFLVSVQDAVNRIMFNPHLYPVVYMDVRRCLVRTFPFGIIFREIKGRIVILAVMHLHRDPDYWKAR
jgi:plasmid stabilization system protein ParE